MGTTVSVVCTAPQRKAEADSLAARLSLPRAESVPDDSDSLALVITQHRLELQQGGRKPPGAVAAEFTSGALARRARQATIRREALARAAGLTGAWRPDVIDATAGLGRDSFVLAALGCPVYAYERHPVVAALLADGLARARQATASTAAAARITLLEGEAAPALGGIQADVVLVDPMHPGRGKSAAVKKEMRLFQRLVGPDADSAGLLAAALDAARYRVVVKRPLRGAALAGIAPAGSITGRAARFDIYRGRANGD